MFFCIPPLILDLIIAPLQCDAIDPQPHDLMYPIIPLILKYDPILFLVHSKNNQSHLPILHDVYAPHAIIIKIHPHDSHNV
jgi:hypothetical protein